MSDPYWAQWDKADLDSWQGKDYDYHDDDYGDYQDDTPEDDSCPCGYYCFQCLGLSWKTSCKSLFYGIRLKDNIKKYLLRRTMKSFRWTVDCKQLSKISQRAWYRFNRLRAIDEKKFYAGFKLGEDKHMFKEELKELEIAYRAKLVDLDKSMEYLLPSLLEYMEDFVKHHKVREEVSEKLENLMEKLDRPLPQAARCDGGECGASNE